MTLAEITSTAPRRFQEGQISYLAWPDFWVSIDNGKPGQWVGYWSRSEVEAVIALTGTEDGSEFQGR